MAQLMGKAEVNTTRVVAEAMQPMAGGLEQVEAVMGILPDQLAYPLLQLVEAVA
jgi:hypothetical protein